jgi:mono/diheme cytochrome c family protein
MTAMTPPRLRPPQLAPARWLALPFLYAIAAFPAPCLLAADPSPKSTSRHAAALRILQTHCVICHGGRATRADLNLTTRATLLRGGQSGPAVVPGLSRKSLLYRRVTHAQKPGMPFKGTRLYEGDIAELAAWIDAGAPYDRPLRKQPEGEGVWWSLRPLVKRSPPPARSVHLADRVWSPIDQFILARLQEKGLRPSPPADRRTWLRRVSFDLIGLPPTPDETTAFLADNSPRAFERVVDRLLASPLYGERWARHWMDVVHYAETHGHDQDRPRPYAWPYRDYLIRSFNQDKPYARFIQDQLAGDVLFPRDPEAIVATGFLATGPWDESSLRDIREDAIDRQIGHYLDRDDMVTTTMSTFVSTTVHCARCHDHKFDPVSQREYYALQAVFAGVDKAERGYDADPRTTERRRDLLVRKARLLHQRAAADPALLTASVQKQVADWEKQVASTTARWTVLDPANFTSTGGATLTKQPDGSLYSGGKRPEVDTYTITAYTNLKGITGIRLEVLTDDRLPHKGPGRQDNGNLHLSEFRVTAAPRNAPTQAKPVPLQNPSADFNQAGWTIAHALDGDAATAWGIYPEVGRPHQAVFEVPQPFGYAEGTTLTFILEQKHGGGHLIGRPRLSLTTTPRPSSSTPAVLPLAVTQALAVAPARRSDRQRVDLAGFVLEKALDQEIAALPAQRLVYCGTNDFKPDGTFRPARTPRPVHVLRRGDINFPQERAVPGTLACVPDLPARFQLADPENEGSRRAALARWISDPRNVLTWRSIVNRVWHYHFGRGLVDTPNDFGRMGSRPTHPELLDWLAVTFQRGGSFKQLHRLIVLSAAYRQSSAHNPQFAALDGDNRYLWRMNRTRLDAESVRDAVLRVNGKLDRTMGGPSVKQFLVSPGVHVTPVVDYLNFDVDRAENYRRSVYRFIFRTLPDPFMEALDCPDSSQLAPVRNASLTALQALAMLNNRFIVRQSEHLAARATRAAPDLPTRLHLIYRFALNRDPTSRELSAVAAYAARHGLANACRIILNTNEFLFIP